MIEESVPEALAGERLDRLVAMIGDCSRSAAATIIADGRVTVNGRVQTSGKHRLRSGDTVRLPIPEAATEALPQADADVPIAVVFEDEHLVVVDKEAGMVVHPGAGNPTGTLVNGLLARYPELAGVGEPNRPGIVHRLDKGTTGLLVVARTPLAYETLVSRLAVHDVERQYLALCWGSINDDRGVVDAPIGRSARNRTVMAVSDSGRHARTHYEVMARRTDDPVVTLVACQLETGRTHQIRVHMAAIGHAIVGDESYRGARLSLPFPRPALHAERLAFAHPATGDRIEFVSPRAQDLAELIQSVLPNA